MSLIRLYSYKPPVQFAHRVERERQREDLGTMLSSGFRAFPRAVGGVVRRTLLPSLASSSASASFSGSRTFTSKVFFDIAIDGEKRDRMEFEVCLQ